MRILFYTILKISVHKQTHNTYTPYNKSYIGNMKYLQFCLLSGLIFAHLALHAQVAIFPEMTAPRNTQRQLYEKGLELFKKGQYGAAEQLFESFIESEELTGDVVPVQNDQYAFARFYQAAGAYLLSRNDAITLLENFTRDFPEHTQNTLVYYYQGRYYFDRREYDKALDPLLIASSRQNLDKDKLDESYFMLGYSYFFEQGNPRANQKEAVRYFNQLSFSENPFQEDARYYKAIILYRQEEYNEAYTALKSLKNSKKYGAELQLYLANSMMKLKKYDELFALADEMMRDKRKPQSPEVYQLVANAAFEREDYPKAIQFFEEFERSRGRLGRIDWYRYGYAYYKIDRYLQAIPPFTRVATLDDSLTQAASYYLGFSYVKQERIEDAKYAYKKAVRRNDRREPIPNDPLSQDALFQYAKLAFSTKDYAESRQALTEIQKYYPRAPFMQEASALLGEAWIQDQNFPEAIKYFESSPPTTAKAKVAYQTACYFQGLNLYESKKFTEADTYLKKAVSLNAEKNYTLSASYWLAESAFRQEKYNASTDQYKAFINMAGAKDNEYYPAANYGLGWSYFKNKNYTSAAKYFEEFVKIGKNAVPDRILVDGYLRAGDVYFLQRQYAKANTYYNKVLELNAAYQDNALYQLAEGYYRQRNYDASVGAFDRLIKGYAKSELRDDALDRISEIYATWIKDYKKAATYANTLVKEYPRSPLAPDAYSRLALAAYESGNQDASVRYFKIILNEYGFDKKNAQLALENLGSLLPEAEFDKILKEYRAKNPELNQNLAQITFNTGVDRFYAGNYASAIGQFTDYISNFKNGPNYFEALVFRARSYKATNQITKALADYETVYSATTKNDFTLAALNEAGDIQFDQKKYTASLKLFETLDELADSPESKAQGKLGMGKNLFAVKNYERAIQVLQPLANDTEMDESVRSRALTEIGEAHYAAGQKDKAFEVFTDVERDYKNEFAARSQYNITQIWFDRGQYQKAKDAGLYLKNNYPTYNYWKAKSFLLVAESNYKLGEIFQAKGVLESLISEERFPEIQEQARKRLKEIENEEKTRNIEVSPEIKN